MLHRIKLREGNVFIGVCHSVHGGGGGVNILGPRSLPGRGEYVQGWVLTPFPDMVYNGICSTSR